MLDQLKRGIQNYLSKAIGLLSIQLPLNPLEVEAKQFHLMYQQADLSAGSLFQSTLEDPMVWKDRYGSVAEESLDSRLKAICDRAGQETGASYSFLLLYDRETSRLYNTAWYGQKQAEAGQTAVVRWVLSRAKPLFLERQADAKEIVGCSLDEEALPLLCAPVMGNADSIGVLGVGAPHSAREEFPRWLPFLESLGELVGALLENQSLLRSLYHKEEQVQNLIRGTLEAQEAERERICLEVHDGVTQTLASVFHHLQALEAVSPEGTPGRQLLLRASALLKQAIRESREVINSLQPATLKDLGLVATLRQEVRQLEQELGWEIEFKADAIRLPKDTETGLYRIIHEAITNARKHADTKRLRIRLTSTNDQVEVEVRDWGIGFNYNSQDVSGRRGTGLLSIRKRAELLQGTCDIQSAPGQGTTVRVQI
jgi:signal transduction histidine kinase